MMIVMIKITNVNMEVAAVKPVWKKTFLSEKLDSRKTPVETNVYCRGSPNITCADDGEEEEPEEA